jgi:23S rRNA U2552 (ribose-2'-O)-methylase RlmE/FtsJ
MILSTRTQKNELSTDIIDIAMEVESGTKRFLGTAPRLQFNKAPLQCGIEFGNLFHSKPSLSYTRGPYIARISDSENILCCGGVGGPVSAALSPWRGRARHGTDKSVYRTPESKALQQCKNDIQREDKWDDFKKITNPYEYVFLSWNRRSSRSVSTHQPLSRSYFKMIELWTEAGLGAALQPLIDKDGGLRTAHSAEGPGGFIEACWEHANRNSWTVHNSFAITLRSEARNVPGWRKAIRFLAERPEIEISDGADGTGNILIRENQDAFVGHVRARYPDGVHVYTADGGFDFSSDYNAQEDVIFPLLLAESLLALRVLQKGGCMVLKCFDTTERPTLDLLWLLSMSFREWKIIKPHTSRAGNAERYFVGIGFVGNAGDVIDVLQNVQNTESWNVPILEHEHDIDEWCEWRSKVFRLQEQIEMLEYLTIRQTLNLIHSHDFAKIRNHVRDNVQRSIRWCTDRGEPISHVWTSDFDRNVNRETQDLMNILSPHSQNPSYNSWYSKQISPVISASTLSFEGFRSSRGDGGSEGEATAINPFMRHSSLFRI